MLFIDCDGVVGDWVGALLAIWNADHGTNFREEDVTDFDMTKLLGTEEWYDIWKEKGFWANISPYPWARELIKAARKSGMPWTFLSSLPLLKTSPTAAMERAWWVEKNFGANPDDHLIICSRKHFVVHAPGDMLIDDKPDTIYKVSEVGGTALTFKQPWNEEVEARGFHRYTPEELIEILRGEKGVNLT